MDKKDGGIRFEFDRAFSGAPQSYGALSLFQIGELCCEPGYAINKHEQWCNEISYIVSGKGKFICNDEEYEVTSGDIIISPLASTHSIIASQKESLRFAYMGFGFNEIEKHSDEEYSLICEFFKKATTFLAHDTNELLQPFNRAIDEFYNHEQYCRTMISGYIMQILIITYRAFTLQKKLSFHNENGSSIKGPVIYSVTSYVEKNIFSKKSINDMAKELGYNGCYLSHTFKERMGQTLQGYILEKKIQKSIEIFNLGNSSITDISARLGYANVQSFSRAFKKLMGIYPSQMIKQIQGARFK